MKNLELVKIYKIGERPKADSPSRVFQEISKIFDDGKEFFVVIHLDTKCKIICREIVHIGGLDQTLIDPRCIFKNAISLSASSIILAHNHPSGDLEPSDEDIQATKKMREAGKILGIDVVDHLIFSDKKYNSFGTESDLRRY